MNTRAEAAETAKPTEEMTAPDAVAVETSSPDVTDGASSSEASVEVEKSSADAIRDAFLEKYGSDEAEDPEAEEAEDDAEAETGEAEEAEPKAAKTDDKSKAKTERKDASADKDDGDDEFRLSDDEFKKLPEGVRNRIGHLNARAKKSERLYEEVRSQNAELQDSHDRFQVLSSFVEDNNIQPENVTLAFHALGQAAQGNWAGFLESLKPFLDFAYEATGAVLPQDLQDRVENGYLSQEDAQELVKSRAAAKIAEQKAQTAQQRSEKVQNERASQDRSERILSAVSSRENELRGADPDYAHKAAAVREQLQSLLEERVPQDEKDAIRMVNKAYDLASKGFVRPAPKPTPKPTPQRPTASTVSRGSPAYSSTKDAIIGAMESYTPARQ